jgi:hypothetical protein
MYLRHATKRTKDGKRTYWTLVRSVRRGRKVVQEVVAHLGRLDAREVREAAAIARHFLGAKASQLDLFEDSQELKPEHVAVGKVRVEHGRGFGDVWMGWVLWQALELGDFCQRHLTQGREAVPWADIASILVSRPAVDPASACGASWEAPAGPPPVARSSRPAQTAARSPSSPHHRQGACGGSLPTATS